MRYEQSLAKESSRKREALVKRAESEGRKLRKSPEVPLVKDDGEKETTWERVKKDPVRHEQYKEAMKERAPDYRRMCPKCKTTHCSKSYEICGRCRGYEYKTKAEEIEIMELLKANNIFFSSRDQVGPCADKENRRRADFVFDGIYTNYIVILEVDENAHRYSDYTPDCEISRLDDLRDQYVGKPILFIRFAVERCKKRKQSEDNVAVFNQMKQHSQKMLLCCLKNAFQLPVPEKNECNFGYIQVYIGYDEKQILELTKNRVRMYSERLGNEVCVDLLEAEKNFYTKVFEKVQPTTEQVANFEIVFPVCNPSNLNQSEETILRRREYGKKYYQKRKLAEEANPALREENKEKNRLKSQTNRANQTPTSFREEREKNKKRQRTLRAQLTQEQRDKINEERRRRYAQKKSQQP